MVSKVTSLVTGLLGLPAAADSSTYGQNAVCAKYVYPKLKPGVWDGVLQEKKKDRGTRGRDIAERERQREREQENKHMLTC